MASDLQAPSRERCIPANMANCPRKLGVKIGRPCVSSSLLSSLSHQPVHRRHPDHKSEEVVDDRVEAAVAQEAPRQVRHALELVVDVQLRRHQHEPERVHERLASCTQGGGGDFVAHF